MTTDNPRATKPCHGINDHQRRFAYRSNIDLPAGSNLLCVVIMPKIEEGGTYWEAAWQFGYSI
jgi:hypothetical protein